MTVATASSPTGRPRVAAPLPRRLRHTTLAVLLAASLGAGAQTTSVRTATGAASGQAGALPAAGFLIMTPDGQAHVHLSRPLAAHERLWVQWPDRAGLPSCCRRLAANALKPMPASEKDTAEAAQENPVTLMLSDGSTAAHYQLRAPDGTAGHSFLGMALVAPQVQAQGALALRAAPDVRARMCAGEEGINLLVQAGQRRQVLYLSLGYPIESPHACTAEDEDFIRRANS